MSNKTNTDLKVKMIRRGLTFNAWAKARGYKPDTVYRAVRGERKGPTSVKILKELQDA